MRTVEAVPFLDKGVTAVASLSWRLALKSWEFWVDLVMVNALFDMLLDNVVEMSLIMSIMWTLLG